MPATEESYTDAKSGTVVYAYHAHLRGLRPEREYLYLALHDGAEPEAGSFRRAPGARSGGGASPSQRKNSLRLPLKAISIR